jgi:hypothetical protein
MIKALSRINREQNVSGDKPPGRRQDMVTLRELFEADLYAEHDLVG